MATSAMRSVALPRSATRVSGSRASSSRCAGRWIRSHARHGNVVFCVPDATLAVVLITNEDDCSVPDDSDLIDPSQKLMSDPLGPFWSFRCNEFGHLCNINGTHAAAAARPADHLQGCVSNETPSGAPDQGRRRGRVLEEAQEDSVANRGRGDHRAADRLQRRDDQEPTSDVEYHPNIKPSCGVERATTATLRCDLAVGERLRRSRPGREHLRRQLSRTRSPSSPTASRSASVPSASGATLMDSDPTTPELDPECQVMDIYTDGQQQRTPDRAAGVRGRSDAALLVAGRRRQLPRRQASGGDPRRWISPRRSPHDDLLQSLYPGRSAPGMSLIPSSLSCR